MTVPITIDGLTDTGFTFDATITEPGTYDLVGTTGGTEVVRQTVAITVGDVAELNLLTVTPATVEADTPTTYTVTGTSLLQVATAILNPEGQATIPLTVENLTDTGFTFDQTLTNPNTYDLVVTGGGGDVLLDAITVTATLNVVSIAPSARQERTPTTYTVTGTFLGTVTSAALEPFGGGTQIPLTIAGVTDTGFTFDGAFEIPGDYDLVVFETAGVEADRLVSALMITQRPAPDVISLMPNPSVVNVANDYAAGGTHLGSIDGAYYSPAADPTAHTALVLESVTEELIKFEPVTFTATGVYDLTVTEAGVDINNYQDAWTIQASFATTLLTVTPATAPAGASVDLTVTYTGQDMGRLLLQPIGGVGPRASADVVAAGGTVTGTLDITALEPGEYDVAMAPSGSDFRTNALRFTLT